MESTPATVRITLRDLRASERRIEKALRLVVRKEQKVAEATEALNAERTRHDALVEQYRQQGRVP